MKFAYSLAAGLVAFSLGAFLGVASWADASAISSHTSKEDRPFLERLEAKIQDALAPSTTKLRLGETDPTLLATPLGHGRFAVHEQTSTGTPASQPQSLIFVDPEQLIMLADQEGARHDDERDYTASTQSDTNVVGDMVAIPTAVGGGADSGLNVDPQADVSEPQEAVADDAILCADFTKTASERIAACTRLLEIDTSFNDDAHALILYRRGVAYVDNEQLDLAMSDFNASLAFTPDDSDVYTARAVVHRLNGDHQLAMADFEEALRLNPNNAWAYYQRGLTHRESGDPVKAMEDYNSALQIAPRYGNALYARGYLHLTNGDYDQSIADYDAYLTLQPGDADALNNRGRTHYAKGDSARAMLDYNAAIVANSGYYYAYFNRGRIHADRGDCQAALKNFEEAIRLVPADQTAADYYASPAWIMAVCPDTSLRDGKKAVIYAETAFSMSDTLETRAILAASYAQAGRFDDAVEVQKSVVEALTSGDKGDPLDIVEQSRRLVLYESGQTYNEAMPIPPEFFVLMMIAVLATPFLIGITIYAAILMNRRFKRLNPALRPYRFGYFVGIWSVVNGLIAGLMLIVIFSYPLDMFGDQIANIEFFRNLYSIMIGLLSVIYVIFGIAYLRQRRWPWVVQLVMSGFSVIWFVVLFVALAFALSSKPDFSGSSEMTFFIVMMLLAISPHVLITILIAIYVYKRWPQLGRIAERQRKAVRLHTTAAAKEAGEQPVSD